MRNPILIVGTFSALAIACQPAEQELTSADREAITEAVQTQLDAFWDAWGATDYDRGMGFYDTHADFQFSSEGVAWFTWEDLDAAIRPLFTTIQSQAINWDTVRIAVLARDVASVTQTASYTQTLADGSVTPETVVAFTSVWVLRGGEWKVLIGHHSQPPASP